MAEVVSTGVSHMCDNSTVSVLIYTCASSEWRRYLLYGVKSAIMTSLECLIKW